MASKSSDSLTARLGLFSKTLPSTFAIFSFLVAACLLLGITSVAIINYANLYGLLPSVIASGALTGILVLLMPTVLTIVSFKFLKRYVTLRHLLFLSLAGAVIYSLFVVIASAVYLATGNTTVANAVTLVGDAGVFAWWLFVTKVLFGHKKKAVLYSIIQPAFNVLLYSAASPFIFTFHVPFGVLVVKLVAGIVVFALVTYLIFYMLDRPLKKKLGFDGIELFSGAVQNWIFDVDMSLYSPFDGKIFGTNETVDAHSLAFRRKDGTLKTTIFAPAIHYGPLGTMGGSNFPYLLGRHAEAKYGTNLVVAHCAVNEDMNPVSASQFAKVREALDRGIRLGKKVSTGERISYYRSSKNGATVHKISIGTVDLVTLTRAPKVTEDVHTDATAELNRILTENGRDCILLDAHNSRYESAPRTELAGVTPNSEYMKNYLDAISSLGKPKHTTKKLKVGASGIDIYSELGAPTDLAPGKLNCVVFKFNGFSYAMLYVNANNALPVLRNAVVEHVKKKFGITAELYTTDTHFVNSLQRSASNVLGRQTTVKMLMPLVERAVREALANVEYVDVFYKKEQMHNFRVWGPEVRARMAPIVSSVMKRARILVPMIVVGGFIIATLIISFV
jgi:predicted neutral ceramidase superfamily lipid hydrolase